MRGADYLYDGSKSIICIGQMEHPRRTIIDATEHFNDLYECHWTPRGWVKFEANKEDLIEIIRLSVCALKALGVDIPLTYVGLKEAGE